MIILGRWRTRKNLADMIDDGVTSGAQFTNDFEFCRWFLMVCSRNVLCVTVSDETERFAQERNSLANDVAVGEDILSVGGDGRVLLGGRRRGKVVRVRGSIGRTGDDLGKGGGRKVGGREGRIRSGNGKRRREGEAILGQVGVDATLLGQGNSETMRTKL
jgi:hypothetical protein